MRPKPSQIAALALFAAAPAVAAGPALPSPPVEAAGVPVVLLSDMNSGRVLLDRHAGLRFVPASMTKVMSAQVAFEEMVRGRLRPRQSFTVPDAIAREWNGKGTSLYLKPAERVPAETLLRAITTVSANDAAMVLAIGHSGSVAGWTALMNAEAAKLGMRDSHFATPNGWPDNGATYVSAHDLAVLAEAMIRRHPQLYRAYIGQKSLGFHGVTQFNKDPAIGAVAGADGIKTGHTAEAGFNYLGSAERGGRRLIMVVAGARSEEERRSASRAMLEWGFAQWRSVPLFAAGAEVAEARVQGGDARNVALKAPYAIAAAVPRAAPGRITLKLRYKGPLKAPLAKGDVVAHLLIDADGAQSSVPLVAAEAVGPAGPLDRLLNGLYGLVS